MAFWFAHLFYQAAVLGRNDLLKKDPSGNYVYAKDYKLTVSDEELLAYAIEGNNLELVMHLKDEIPGEYDYLLTIAAANNSEEVIEYIYYL